MGDVDTWLQIQELRRNHAELKRTLKRRIGGENGEEANVLSVVAETSIDPALERRLLEGLLNPMLEFPLAAGELYRRVKMKGASEEGVHQVLRKFAAQELLEMQTGDPVILSVNLERASALGEGMGVVVREEGGGGETKKPRTLQEDIEFLLNAPSVRDSENKRMGAEILDLLNTKSVMEQLMLEKFQSAGGSQLREFCFHKTRDDCRKQQGTRKACNKLHFRKIIQAHTDELLGDCSFLNTCFHMETCKFVHYTIDNTTDETEPSSKAKSKAKLTSHLQPKTKLTPSQWIDCDLRTLDMSVLGKYSVIMADPPWDIHMELPYGTMSDDEMRALNIPALQDEGYIFLWVTGRAMELGRECLTLWGYERVDELIWVKTNQLQRLIRTGRTGHWINHGKEHCLVGVKGNPPVSQGIDCDVIVAEVRETSHKPDEIYGIIERLSPGTLKIELFGRQHNCQPNWMTLGNQLDGINIIEPDVAEMFWKRYPNGQMSALRAQPPGFQPPI